MGHPVQEGSAGLTVTRGRLGWCWAPVTRGSAGLTMTRGSLGQRWAPHEKGQAPGPHRSCCSHLSRPRGRSAGSGPSVRQERKPHDAHCPQEDTGGCCGMLGVVGTELRPTLRARTSTVGHKAGNPGLGPGSPALCCHQLWLPREGKSSEVKVTDFSQERVEGCGPKRSPGSRSGVLSQGPGSALG